MGTPAPVERPARAALADLAAQELRAAGLTAEVPAAVRAQAEAASDAPIAALTEPAVRDLRRTPWFSIDNDDTLDLDQLTWAEALPQGATRLSVAIADVDARVPQGSPADRHAAVNTSSVYTAGGVFPMLPPRWSNDLTSLREGADRLAVVVEMTVDADGAVADTQLFRACVRNHAKLAYDSVADWLDGSGAAPPAVARDAALAAQIRLHDAAAQALRRWRHRRGALNVATAQARPVFADGRLVDLRAHRKNRATELIADLMIATNGVVARFLAERGLPSLRRVLQEPRRWDRLRQLAERWGHALPPAPDAPALDRFLLAERRRDPAGFEALSLSVVKLLGSGAYAAAAPDAPPAGHFGLAVNDYAHSTAPNRRYVDLVTQRLVKASLAGRPAPYTLDELAAIAAHCTLREDQAATVERRVLKAAAAHLLQDRIGEVFDATVTGTPTKGTFVRIASPLVEGRVVGGFEGLDVGDALRVRLRSVDVERRHVDFERV